MAPYGTYRCAVLKGGLAQPIVAGPADRTSNTPRQSIVFRGIELDVVLATPDGHWARPGHFGATELPDMQRRQSADAGACAATCFFALQPVPGSVGHTRPPQGAPSG